MPLNILKRVTNFYKKSPLVAVSIAALMLFFVITSTFAVNLITSDSISSRVRQALAASEPTNCPSPSGSTPTFNSYITKFNSPNVNPTTCSDLPLLSFFPVDTANGNPRSVTRDNGNISIMVSYMNTANPGSAAIANPNVAVYVDKLSETQFKISAQLSGGNNGSISSAADGGDLIVNVPAGTKLQIVKNQTVNWPDAIERKEEAEDTGRTPSEEIPDNSINNSNPLYARFADQTLASNAGFNFKPAGLEAGFLGHGYILSQIGIIPAEVNTPPTINGSEITCIRGQACKFPVVVTPRDKEDTPDKITVTPKDLPGFVTPGTGIKDTTDFVIRNDANTPVRTVFTLTPRDSSGLDGTPGTWIINIIDPIINITKNCLVAGTTNNCGTQKPGDKVTYVIKVINGTSIDLTNVVVSDDYDQTKLESISNINPAANKLDTENGVITWNIPKMTSGEVKEIRFDALVKMSQTKTTIENIASVKAEGLPSKEARVTFDVVSTPDLGIGKTCLSTVSNKPCNQSELKAGNIVNYTVTVKNTGNATATNVKVTDDYDQTKLHNISNVNPKPESINIEAGVINWSLGNMDPNAVIVLTYQATILNTVVNGDKIDNVATVSADGIPPKSANTIFPILTPQVTLIAPVTGGVSILGAWAAVIGAGAVAFYLNSKKSKYATGFTPSRSSEE